MPSSCPFASPSPGAGQVIIKDRHGTVEPSSVHWDSVDGGAQLKVVAAWWKTGSTLIIHLFLCQRMCRRKSKRPVKCGRIPCRTSTVCAYECTWSWLKWTQLFYSLSHDKCVERATVHSRGRRGWLIKDSSTRSFKVAAYLRNEHSYRIKSHAHPL